MYVTGNFSFGFCLLHRCNKKLENLISGKIFKSAFLRQTYVRFRPKKFHRNPKLTCFRGIKYVNNCLGQFSGFNPFVTRTKPTKKKTFSCKLKTIKKINSLSNIVNRINVYKNKPHVVNSGF